MKPTFPRVVIAAALGFGLVVQAAAQDHAAGPGAPAGPRGGDRQQLFEDLQHRREQRLHDLLQIKPDQETAFRTFVSSVELARSERGQRRRGPGRDIAPGEREPLTAPQRLDRAVQRLADAEQRLQKTAAAMKTFYAALSPEQRKAFDAMPMMIGAGNGFAERIRFGRRGFQGPLAAGG